MTRTAFMVVALLLTGSWGALPVFAPVEARAAQVEETALDDQVREIAKTLRCAICQTENIWESQSVLAAQMRAIIRERLKAGETPDQIKAYFLSRYGDYILMKPRVRGWNWVIWAGPFVLLLIGGIMLTRTLSRWSASAASTPADPLPPLSEPSRKRIDNELRAYDQ